ncbi:hypothetical protein GALMADRAFT_700017 [Galerina marginata CBS 339.88]|uniref:F-box domain-containing protein n=1 Tax=Galerina marginata (strain CBS 339.88) TaxID=685588 RepID=A0A067TW24_GALM3|nr:hypothetical protein GALMADRAFT_700017 [Galerina marginata CBS 339.88]
MGLLQRCPGYLCDNTTPRNELDVPQGYLCNICSEVAQIDAQIIRTRNLLADLTEKRDTVKNRRLNRLHDPLMCIPVEVTSQIFVFYNDIKRMEPGLSSAAFKKDIDWSPSLFLASISQGWRQIALATSELWTSIDIQVYSLANIPLQAELLNQCLDRSGKRLLVIRLIAKPKMAFPADSPVKMSPLFDVIRQCAPRWQKLFVHLPQRLYAAFVGDLTCAPSLVHLELEPMGGTVTEQKCFQLAETPSLTHLDISRQFLSQIDVQWYNLTTFNCGILSIDELFELLRRAKRLLQCGFFILFEDCGDYPLPEIPIVHQSLRKLRFVASNTSDDSTLEALFNGIELPSLDEIHIDCSDTAQLVSVPRGLHSLFERSRCPLTQFSICNDKSSGLDILSILESLPTVTNLYLEGRKMMTNTVLKLLGERTLTEDGTFQFRILPNRKTLVFVGKRGFQWQSLMDAFFPGWKEASDTRPSTGSPSPTWPFTLRFNLALTKSKNLDYIDADIVPHLVNAQKEMSSIKLEIGVMERRVDLIELSWMRYLQMDVN